MDISLNVKTDKKISQKIKIAGSKSESNRLLILKKLFPEVTIENISDSDDSAYLENALSSSDALIGIGHAGTAMRFLVSYFAARKDSEVILTGSERMQNRPIGILVDALRELGANITYLEKEGYPPLKIKGTTIRNKYVKIDGNVSSQFISSLILMGARLPKGLEIELTGKKTSGSYIDMTLSLLEEIGIPTRLVANTIKVIPPKNIKKRRVIVESDWSSASYFYSVIALSKIGTEIELASYKKNSLQGDSCLASIYEHFGVATKFHRHSIILTKERDVAQTPLKINLTEAPDIAQTIAVTCFGTGVACHLTGLHTLKIKETDRLVALDVELKKLGAEISVTDDTLQLSVTSVINENIAIKTYDDHRMAMAFAPLAFKVPIKILNAEVVSKSYLNFWEDMKQIGVEIEEL